LDVYCPCEGAISNAQNNTIKIQLPLLPLSLPGGATIVTSQEEQGTTGIGSGHTSLSQAFPEMLHGQMFPRWPG